MLSRHFIWKHEFHNLDHLFNSSYLILNKDVLYYSEQQFLQGKYPKSDQNILDQGQQILDKDQIQPTVKLYWKTVMSTDLHIVYDYVHTCMVSCIKSCLTLQLHGRFLCPWDSPVKNTEGGCHFLLQGILPTQASNPRLLHLLYWQVDSLPQCYLGSHYVIHLFLKSHIYILRQAASCPCCRWVNSISEWASCHRTSQARKWTVMSQSSTWSQSHPLCQDLPQPLPPCKSPMKSLYLSHLN